MSERPINYPHNSASGIYDAQAFTVGNSTVVHKPKAFRPHDDNGIIGGTVVSAACGAYGYTGEERDYRAAVWAGGIGEGFHGKAWCQTCFPGWRD